MQYFYLVRNINPVMRIVIIGTGNTASVLGKLCQQAGHTITQVLGRTNDHAQQLALRLNSPFTIHNDQLAGEADIYIIAVSDPAIGEIAGWLRISNKLVVHTAGSIEKDTLQDCSKNFGVLYPLQSLRKEINDVPEIPFLIDGNTEESCTLIYDFAKTISSKVEVADDKKRMMTHLAAVMVSNFTNHLYALAEDFCNGKRIDFKMLLPLIKEVANRLEVYSPQDIQTGPAIRNDVEIIDNHIFLLEHFPLHQSIYRLLSESIQKRHGMIP